MTPYIKVPKRMTAQEVAKLLKVKPVTVYSWKQRGTLDFIRVGGRIKFDWKDVKKMLRKRRMVSDD